MRSCFSSLVIRVTSFSSESNPIDWNKFGELPKTPSSLESAVNMALDNNPELNKLKYELDNSKISIKKKH